MKEVFTACINEALPYAIGGAIGFVVGAIVGWLL